MEWYHGVGSTSQFKNTVKEAALALAVVLGSLGAAYLLTHTVETDRRVFAATKRVYDSVVQQTQRILR